MDQFYRAVMFKVQGQGDEAHYVYLGVWPHDDAIAFAQRASLSVNPVNGIAELILADAPKSPRAGAGEPVPAAVAAEAPVEATSLLADLGLSRGGAGRRAGSGRAAGRAGDVRDHRGRAAGRGVGAVEWQGSALVELASGASVAEVKASLMLDAADETTPVDEVDEDTRIISALKHPAARMQFSFVEDNEELRRAIEDEDFAAWRVFLHPEQRTYATKRYNGSFRLSGGAGTGKTVVLLHRARMLHQADPQARIVLTTFTKTLAESMRRDLQALDPTIVLAKSLGDPGVFVVGVDAAVSAALKTAAPGELKEPIQRVLGQRTDRIQARNTKSAEQWRDSIESASSDVPPDLRHAAFFEAEYAMVVLPQRITTPRGVLQGPTPGRGVSLNRERRSAVWDVVGAYRASSSVNGAVDFGEAAALAAALLETRSARPADHVLVDEGQDLNPTQWQFLRALVAEGPDDIFIAEDSHQRIYGQRVVVGRYGIKIVGRSRRLALNYRTTAQNLHFAVGVLEGGEYLDIEEEATGGRRVSIRAHRSGAAPGGDVLDHRGAGAGRPRSSPPGSTADVVPDTIGILVRDAAQANQISRGLEERGVPVRVITNQAGSRSCRR